MSDEAAWWSNPPGGIEANAWGVPPYDADAAAERVVTALGAKPGDMLLDLGCGPGRTMERIRRGYGIGVTGVDASTAMLSLAERNCRNAWLILGDGRRIPEQAHFNHAYSITMFQHIPHDATARYIKQIHDRLPVGGRFIFSHSLGEEPQTFLNHQCTMVDIVDWLSDAGFRKFLPIAPSETLDSEPSRVWVCVEREATEAEESA